MRTNILILATATCLLTAVAVGAATLGSDGSEPTPVGGTTPADTPDDARAAAPSTTPGQGVALASESPTPRVRAERSAVTRIVSTGDDSISTTRGANELLEGAGLDAATIAQVDSILAAERRARRQVLQDLGALDSVDPAALRSALEALREQRDAELTQLLGDTAGVLAEIEAEAAAFLPRGGSVATRPESPSVESSLSRASEARSQRVPSPTTTTDQ